MGWALALVSIPAAGGFILGWHGLRHALTFVAACYVVLLLAIGSIYTVNVNLPECNGPLFSPARDMCEIGTSLVKLEVIFRGSTWVLIGYFFLAPAAWALGGEMRKRTEH